MAAAYQVTGNHQLYWAAEGFQRAARPPWGRVPLRTEAGDALRTAAWLLCRYQGRHSLSPVLMLALVGLVLAVAALRATRRRHH